MQQYNVELGVNFKHMLSLHAWVRILLEIEKTIQRDVGGNSEGKINVIPQLVANTELRPETGPRHHPYGIHGSFEETFIKGNFDGDTNQQTDPSANRWDYRDFPSCPYSR